jgi:parvulin-like peptidyl-prolyl isomerase
MARQPVLENLVVERLLDEQVVAAGIKITDEEVTAEIVKAGAQRQPPITLEQFKAAVEAQGGTFEDAKKDFGRNMGYMRLMEPQMGEKIRVSDEEAKQYYDSHLVNFAIPEQIRASHILITTRVKDPNADPNQVKAAAKEKAGKLLKQIKEGGDFAAIAKANSDDPGSVAEGGDLGFFPRGKMVPPFDQAAFATKVGDISDLVETTYGYHIIKVTDHKDASTTPFEEIKAKIVDGLSGQKRQTIIRQYVQSLREKAKIRPRPRPGGHGTARDSGPSPPQAISDRQVLRRPPHRRPALGNARARAKRSQTVGAHLSFSFPISGRGSPARRSCCFFQVYGSKGAISKCRQTRLPWSPARQT